MSFMKHLRALRYFLFVVLLAFAGSYLFPSAWAKQDELVQTVTVVGKKLKYKPDHFTVTRGQKVRVVFKNEGFISHSFDIPPIDVRTDSIQPGDTLAVTFTPQKTGTIEYWCDVAEHKVAGMKGTITVKEP